MTVSNAPRTTETRPAGTTPTERVTLTAADGYGIAATLFESAGPPRANLVVAGATGVKQSFYRRFAEFAAARGYRTLTLDYRGIGQSAPPSLKGFRMDYLDWGRLDLAAAVDHMATTERPLFMVGHSYGGHAVGLLPNVDRIDAFYTFATGAGWDGYMPPRERARVWFLWNLVAPVLTRYKGYLAWSHLGMGEDLPIDVYRQWKAWCRYPHYFFDDPAMKEVVARFEHVRMPMVAVNATDDLWALPTSRDAFMAGYRNAKVDRVDIDPRNTKMTAIGHMGYFRPAAKPLWEDALAWFETQAGKTAS